MDEKVYKKSANYELSELELTDYIFLKIETNWNTFRFFKNPAIGPQNPINQGSDKRCHKIIMSIHGTDIFCGTE